MKKILTSCCLFNQDRASTPLVSELVKDTGWLTESPVNFIINRDSKMKKAFYQPSSGKFDIRSLLNILILNC